MTSSLPPHLLRRPGSLPGSGPRGRNDAPTQLRDSESVPDQPAPQLRQPQRLTVTVGEPGTYDPQLSAADRPGNLTVLRDAARPATPQPWPAGSYVLVGTTGKRAHWTGSDWKGGASPGYAAPAVRSEPEQSAGDDPDDDLDDDTEDDQQ